MVAGILAPTVGLKHPWVGPTDLGMEFSEKGRKKKTGKGGGGRRPPTSRAVKEEQGGRVAKSPDKRPLETRQISWVPSSFFPQME